MILKQNSSFKLKLLSFNKDYCFHTRSDSLRLQEARLPFRQLLLEPRLRQAQCQCE